MFKQKELILLITWVLIIFRLNRIYGNGRGIMFISSRGKSLLDVQNLRHGFQRKDFIRGFNKGIWR